MKTRLLCLSAAVLLSTAAASNAGWARCGWGGGGGGYCGPRYGWGGWCGPAFGISFVAPVPVYRPVYYATPVVYYTTPAPVYATAVRYVKPAPAASSTLARAQSQLANLGYYSGTVDGAYGPLTSRAVTQYQADYGLPATGRLDRATLKSLGI